MHFAYILECSDGTFYAGSTSDLDARVHAHNHLKSGAHYTKIRRPAVLRHAEPFGSYAEARAREAAFKRMDRSEKLRLITHA